MPTHVLRFPYAQRVAVWTHLEALGDPILPADPDRVLREGEVVVSVRVVAPEVAP